MFGSGYLANSGIIPALLGPEDVIFVDELAHACIWAGAKLSSAKIVIFPHNDTGKSGRLTASTPRAIPPRDDRHGFGLFHGWRPRPGRGLADLADAHDAWLLTDDAHGLGVVPKPPGAIVCRCKWARSPRPSAVMAAISAPRHRSSPSSATARVVLSTQPACRPAPLPPPSHHLDFIAANPAYAARPLAKARRFTQALDLPDATSPIVPVIIGEARAALAASKSLEEAGFLVTAIRPPTVPARHGKAAFHLHRRARGCRYRPSRRRGQRTIQVNKTELQKKRGIFMECPFNFTL